MHVLRSHFTLVSASVFLTGLLAVAASAALGLIGPWEAAELAACGALFAVCAHLALTLRRLIGETGVARSDAEQQDLELTEVAAESRDELVERMDGLVERLAGTAALTAELRSTGRGLPESSGAHSEAPAAREEADGDSDRSRVPAEATEHAEAAS